MTIFLDNFSIRLPSDNGTILLDSISQSISMSGLYFLTGHSGSGKTLLGRSLAGLLPENVIAEGKISFSGETKKLLYAPQFATGFFLEESAIQTNFSIIVSQTFRLSQSEKTALLNFLPLFGLEALSDKLNHPVKTLSAGMKYRLMVLCLLMKNPSFLIIDEPFASLDETTASKVLDVLMNVHKTSGMGLMIITHVIPKQVSPDFERIHLEKRLVNETED